MPAETDIVVPDGAELAHGFRNDSPMPTPSSCRNSENPAAAIPPAAIAPHETADESASSGTATTLSVTRVAIVGLLEPRPCASRQQCGAFQVPSSHKDQGTFSAKRLWKRRKMEVTMGFGRGFLLWILGIPLPIILLLALFWR
jgi:hypothetical protein